MDATTVDTKDPACPTGLKVLDFAEQARIASARALHMTWNLVLNKNL